MEQQKVVLIGINNYNGLGLVRSFGRHGIRPYGIIVGVDSYNGYVEKSKYWEKIWHVDDAEDIIDCLLENFKDEKIKPVVIPYIDKVTQLLDLRYEEFSSKFILPSINHKSGEIEKLASKKQQEKFAKSLGYNVLETELITFDEDVDISVPSKFPIILKPVSGGEGDKHDITICNCAEDYKSAIDTFVKKGYKRILQQFYLAERTEYVILGAISGEHNFSSYTILRNIRQWPKNYGIGCFSEYVTESVDATVNNFVNKLFEDLGKYGYDGPIDIEVFMDNQKNIYINEFNWRVSGRNFTSLDTKIHSVVWWYKLKTGEKIEADSFVNQKTGYTMKESEDIKNVLFRNISLKQWLGDLKRTKSYALFDKKDMKPALYRYAQLFKSLLAKSQNG